MNKKRARERDAPVISKRKESSRALFDAYKMMMSLSKCDERDFLFGRERDPKKMLKNVVFRVLEFPGKKICKKTRSMRVVSAFGMISLSLSFYKTLSSQTHHHHHHHHHRPIRRRRRLIGRKSSHGKEEEEEEEEEEERCVFLLVVVFFVFFLFCVVACVVITHQFCFW